ncbi:MAG: hypothetical protein JWM11_2551 [Planctomycetaceae bacterium]|nr:hypothetical protein [Planctomycetaceae bacterium]
MYFSLLTDRLETCPTQRLERLQWLIVSGTLCLILATWPLWWPSTHFPQVPWFSWGCAIPIIVDRALLVIMSSGLAAIFFAPVGGRGNLIGLLTFATSAMGLVLLNQQRTQPWMYQLILMALVLATAPSRLAFGLLRLLTVSIYFYSGISKLDVSFCHGLGQRFLETAFAIIRLEPSIIGVNKVIGGGAPVFGFWPLLFPIGEIVVALAFTCSKTRRIGLWAACAMHIALLLILGPFGLQHQNGVLIWNVFFIVLNFILFSRPRPVETGPTLGGPTTMESPQRPVQRRGAIFAAVLIGWAVIWPCLEPFGVCDLWPAWGLYAEHGEELLILVNDSGTAKLPAWLPVRDAWRYSVTSGLEACIRTKQKLLLPGRDSLDLLHAPVYPSNRFLLGYVLKIASEGGLEQDEISVEWKSPANRWTGHRTVQTLANLAEIEQAADKCWFNARPRDHSK